VAPNAFPDEFRDTLERLIKLQIDSARARGNAAPIAELESALARLRSPEFGLCQGCRTVLSFVALVRDLKLSLCERCGSQRA